MTSDTPKPDSAFAAEIDALLTELAESGMNTAAFARSRGMPPWKLYNALRAQRLRRQKGAPAQSSFSPVIVRHAPLDADNRLELVVSQSLRLKVPEHFDEATLRRLLRVFATC